MWNAANLLTVSRMGLALAILFTRPFSAGFYALYALCGATDMADGPVARRTGTAGELGARLDSAADALFVLICLVKLLPAIRPRGWLLAWAGGIALVKAVNLMSGLVRRGRLVLPHTAANKAAGALLFLTPPLFGAVPTDLIFFPACAVTTFAAIQEGCILRSKN